MFVSAVPADEKLALTFSTKSLSNIFSLISTCEESHDPIVKG